MGKTEQRLTMQPITSACNWGNAFDVVVVGGGAAGIGVTASLLRRRPSLRIAIIEPNDKHYYQLAWTLVGGGAFDIKKTVQATSEVIPKNAQWIQASAAGFDPESGFVRLADGRSVGYRQLIVCPGLRLAWEEIEGLEETLGENGVTSNYSFDLAPYTWSLVHNSKVARRFLPSHPCQSNARARPRKRCIFHVINGYEATR